MGFFTQAIFTHTQLRFPPKKHACLGLGLCQNVVFGHEKCFFNSVSEVSRNIIYEQRLLYIAQKSISFDDIVFFFGGKSCPADVLSFISHLQCSLLSFIRCPVFVFDREVGRQILGYKLPTCLVSFIFLAPYYEMKQKGIDWLVLIR